MNIKTKLGTWKKKTIGKFELKSMMHISTDEELWNLISNAVEEGLLSPIKASGTDGNRKYPVYMKYRIKKHEDHSDAISEISMLHPLLTNSGYLQSNPNAYIENQNMLQKLNRYLFAKQSMIPVSRKERSFLIFGEEKQLDERSFLNLLNHMGMTPKALKYYDTPEYCFNDFIPERKSSMVLLICENKDIWFNIRRRMYEDGANEIFNTHIDGVVYGCGNRISESGALSGYTGFMGAEAVRYLYWGDIDRAGLNIYLSLLENNPEMDIRFFTAAYAKMISMADDIVVPDSADHREITGNYEKLYILFSDEVREKLIRYIDDNKRIPQEIVNYECLLTNMR